MGKKLVMFLVFGFLVIGVIPMISAADFTVRESTDFDVKIPCFYNNTYCSSSAGCNFSFNDPLGNKIISNQIMTQDPSLAFFNYTLNKTQTARTGEHTYSVICTDAGGNGKDAGTILVTPSGTELDTSQGIIYMGLVFVLIVAMAFAVYGLVIANQPYTKMGAFLSVYGLAVAIAYMGWILTENFLTNAVFIGEVFRIIFTVLMFGLFPTIILSLLWALFLMARIKEVKMLMDHGLDRDEALERVNRRK